MMNLEENASDLLDRLEELRLGEGLSEDDLLGTVPAGNSFRTFCVALARRVWAGIVVVEPHRGEHVHPLVVRLIQEGQSDGGGEKHGGDGGGEKHGGDGGGEKHGGDGLNEALYGLAVGVGYCGQEKGRIAVLDFLVSTVQALVLLMRKKQSEFVDGDFDPHHHSEDVVVDDVSGDMETQNAIRDGKECSAYLRKMGQLIGQTATAPSPLYINTTSRGDSAVKILSDVCAFVEDSKEKLPQGFFDVIVSADSLDHDEKIMLEQVYTELRKEAEMRRQMMRDRALVTLKSFSTSPKVRAHGTTELMSTLDRILEDAMVYIDGPSQVQVDDVYTTTKGEMMSLLLENTHGAGEKKRSFVKTMQIGDVPDRGGRPEGQTRAASLMPEWAPRKKEKKHSFHPGRGGGRGGHGSTTASKDMHKLNKNNNGKKKKGTN